MRSILAVMLLSCLAAVARAQPAADRAFSVVSVKGGTLTVAGKKALAGATVRPGDVLSLSGGRAIIDAGGQGKVMLKGRTKAKRLGGGEQGFELSRGAILSALPHLLRPFRVQTQAFVAAVRGTEFFVETEGGVEAYLCVCSGTIEASSPESLKQRPLLLSAPHPHAAWSFHRGRDGSFEHKDDVMRGHTDADLAQLR